MQWFFVLKLVSPASQNWEETNSTLKFAERVKKVQVKAHQNQVLDEKALIQKYKMEIAELRNKLLETNEMLERERKLQDSEMQKSIRQQYEEQLHESQLVRTALKERIEHLTKLILSSSSVTPKAILDWNAPADTGDKRASVIMDGLLPQAKQADGIGGDMARASRIGRKSMRLSRQLSDKDFVRKQIAEIDRRDERIKQLENLMSLLKSSTDVRVQSIIASFTTDPEQTIQGTEELNEEVQRLRRERQEMEIVINEQNEKLELLEQRGGGSTTGTNPAFEQSTKYKEMALIISQQRQTVEDRDTTIKLLKTQIAELRTSVRNLELSEFENLEKLAAAGDPQLQKSSNRASINISTRLREAEQLLETERKLRSDESTQATELIAALESELAIAKAELSISQTLFNQD
ncbi:hypothetical protein HK101_009904 [Irineochytrium annulatum]|nr:hypothetical protein HK101_009904 [Irineochytrium annulatum]